MSEDTIIRARQAEVELVETDAAFAAIRQGLIDAVLTTKIGESTTRDRLVLTIQGLDQVHATLKAIVQSGKDAQAIQAHVEALKITLS